MKAEELNVLLEVVKEYQPLIKACLPLLGEVGSDVRPLIESLVDALADLQIRFFNRLLEKGMNREEALRTLNSVTAGMGKLTMSK